MSTTVIARGGLGARNACREAALQRMCGEARRVSKSHLFLRLPSESRRRIKMLASLATPVPAGSTETAQSGLP